MVLNKNIEMVAAFNKEGKIVPVRFRVFSEDESYSVFTVSKILKVDEIKIDRIETIIFTCISTINEVQKNIELKYIKDTCKWYLYKMSA
ncbi:hypothetical protein [Clostridium fungisolvens]|uniref:Uncharacterized protein n=1 Tax=Clostridium fungisolvens TaxID=1604897 RepID=A0A6V8SN44_9CLOT|nr:hypothetical protein [Clostridium fungisolvens]GFP76303.1 hypothetical protein bsdtw1_02405 [Clostridium fungisolvens]